MKSGITIPRATLTLVTLLSATLLLTPMENHAADKKTRLETVDGHGYFAGGDPTHNAMIIWNHDDHNIVKRHAPKGTDGYLVWQSPERKAGKGDNGFPVPLNFSGAHKRAHLANFLNVGARADHIYSCPGNWVNDMATKDCANGTIEQYFRCSNTRNIKKGAVPNVRQTVSYACRRCAATVKNACKLKTTAHGRSSGACVNGYRGNCAYQCNDGTWSRRANTCALVIIRPEPGPDPLPDPTPRPDPEPKPDPDPRPDPEPKPDPDPEPEPKPGPDPEPEPKPGPNPKPEPEPEPDPEPEPEPVPCQETGWNPDTPASDICQGESEQQTRYDSNCALQTRTVDGEKDCSPTLICESGESLCGDVCCNNTTHICGNNNVCFLKPSCTGFNSGGCTVPTVTAPAYNVGSCNGGYSGECKYSCMWNFATGNALWEETPGNNCAAETVTVTKSFTCGQSEWAACTRIFKQGYNCAMTSGPPDASLYYVAASDSTHITFFGGATVTAECTPTN